MHILSMAVTVLVIAILGQLALGLGASSAECEDDVGQHVLLLQSQYKLVKSSALLAGHRQTYSVQGADLPHVFSNDAAKGIKERLTNMTLGTDPATVMRLKKNSKDDTRYFVWSVVCYGCLIGMAMVLFSQLKDSYPLVYRYNTFSKESAQLSILNPLPDGMQRVGFFGWMWESHALQLNEELVKLVGLDMVMFLKFQNVSMRLLLRIGVPMILVLCPLQAIFGTQADVTDWLTKISMNNLKNGSWIFWFHALAVWYVVWTTQAVLTEAQEKFVQYRCNWFRQMQPPRSTSILFQNIPEEYQSIDKLTDMINGAFPVKSNVVDDILFVVKPTQHLTKMLHLLVAAEDRTRNRDTKVVEDTNNLQTDKNSGPEKQQSDKDLKEKSENQMLVAAIKDKVAEERRRIKNEEVSSVAFVRFKEKQYSDIFLNIRLVANDMEFVRSVPPDPMDVAWEHLLIDPYSVTSLARVVSGYVLILCLFLLFTPIVTFISTATRLSNLHSVAPHIAGVIERYSFVSGLWNTVFASLGLTLFMGMLPTCIMMIFQLFFPYKASSEAQLFLQRWLFCFALVFVVLVTALGSSITSALLNIVDHPTVVFEILARALPTVTHFYLTWYPLQWFTLALGLLRYSNLFQYIRWTSGYHNCLTAEETKLNAKLLSEPENQTSYGIGARSAESMLYLVVALVFCSLTPIICMVAWMTFAINRIICGYLIVFAETRKPDLGGPFWCEQLWQIHATLFLYIVLMTGVLAERADDACVSLVALSCIPYQAYCYCRFCHSFRVDVLPFLWKPAEKDQEENGFLLEPEEFEQKNVEQCRLASYVQPELLD